MATKMINQETHELLGERKWLERVAYNLVRDEDQARDVAQDTFLAALKSARPKGRPLRGWLARVATNVVRMNHRGGTRRAAREKASGYIDDSPPKSGARLLFEKQAASKLGEAVQRLDAPLRSAVLLRFVDDMTIAQVAAELRVPVGTADSRIREGLRRLRVDLDAQGDGDARPWLMALCPAVDVSETQAASAAATGGIPMTKIALLLAALLAVGVLFITQRGAGAADQDEVQAASVVKADEQHETERRPSSFPFRDAVANRQLVPSAKEQSSETGDRTLLAQSAARPHFRFRFLDTDREHSDALREAVDLESILYLATDCYQQFTQRHPDFRGDSEVITVDIAVAFDEAAGAVATNTELGVQLGSAFDDDFEECLAESSFGVDFYEDPTDLRAGHVRLEMIFPSEETTAQGQRDAIRKCEEALDERHPGLSKKEAKFEDREFTLCLETNFMGLPTQSELEARLNAAIEPCYAEAKAQHPELDIAGASDKSVLHNTKEFKRCADDVFSSFESMSAIPD